MSSYYPGGIDSFPTNRADGTVMATTHPADHNNHADAINKIEATLGVNPQGAHVTVAERLGGVARVLGPFPFAFDDAGLNEGIEFYTPGVGDLMLNLGCKRITAWNGTTPRSDVGQFIDETGGLVSWTNVSSGGWFMAESPAQSIYDKTRMLGPGLGEYGNMYEFVTADPLKFVVSQNGQAGGVDPGASQGECALFIVVATPSLA